MSIIDWSKAAEGNFPIFPANTLLKVRIQSVKRVTSSKKGTPGMQFMATVVEPEEFATRLISVTCWLVEGAEWKVAGLVEACGLTGMPKVDMDSEAFLNICQACVGHTTLWFNAQRVYEGKPSNDITDFQPDPDQTVTEFSQDEDAPDFART